MLVLTRKLNQTIVINDQIVVKVLRVENGAVKLGIQAPSSIPVHRQEVHEAIQSGASQANKGGPPCFTALEEKSP